MQHDEVVHIANVMPRTDLVFAKLVECVQVDVGEELGAEVTDGGRPQWPGAFIRRLWRRHQGQRGSIAGAAQRRGVDRETGWCPPRAIQNGSVTRWAICARSTFLSMATKKLAKSILSSALTAPVLRDGVAPECSSRSAAYRVPLPGMQAQLLAIKLA